MTELCLETRFLSGILKFPSVAKIPSMSSLFDFNTGVYISNPKKGLRFLKFVLATWLLVWSEKFVLTFLIFRLVQFITFCAFHLWKADSKMFVNPLYSVILQMNVMEEGAQYSELEFEIFDWFNRWPFETIFFP